MKLISTLLAVAIFSIAYPVLAAEEAATVNGKAIKQSLVDFIQKDADLRVKESESRGKKLEPVSKDAIVNQLVSTEIVFQEAQRLGLDKTKDFLAREELQRRELLVNTFIQDFIKKNPVTDAEARAAYDKQKSAMGTKEYSARHILVKTENEAKDIIAQLDKKVDFAKLAKEKSVDSSKQNGGDLGWFSPAVMVKPFGDAVATLKKGAYTATPVQSQFGWHVIKLEDTREAQPPVYSDKLKNEIKQQMQQINLQKALVELKNKSKIDIKK